MRRANVVRGRVGAHGELIRARAGGKGWARRDTGTLVTSDRSHRNLQPHGQLRGKRELYRATSLSQSTTATKATSATSIISQPPQIQS